MSTYDSILSSYPPPTIHWMVYIRIQNKKEKLGEWQKLPVPEIDDADSPEIHFGDKDWTKILSFQKDLLQFSFKKCR
ncbi:MAG: hypothetical protein CM15mV43_920 [uncultured marine virus]|nr:MAG: hypothetical protein CM15mV43_920 [uncultured marine virus]